ncbi:MAG TPA: bifunctional diguanylate cyclase/phosphodiesterase [Candidatus Saccharimonadales bacterium]|nr:bifunctional diguanylate cyclase/phosphodiesterase [Candidatus Saccharimonadales bacterium]
MGAADLDPAEAIFDGSTDLRIVRLRLFLALVTMFVIPIAIATPVIYGFASKRGDTVILPTAAIAAIAVLLGVLTVWLARRVLEPAERLDRARVILEDAYARARAESLRDSLTGLGNHRAFQEELERQWVGAQRSRTRLAIAIVDLDDFRLVNETEGHVGGDRVLVHAAATLAAGVSRMDKVYRTGGDEFAVLMPGSDPEAAYLSIRRVLATALEGTAGRTRGSVGVPGGPWSFTAGVAGVPGTAGDRASLYREADAALIFGKRHGRTQVTAYDPAKHSSSAMERPLDELAAEVARVATVGALKAVFQPIFDLGNGHPRGYEGLVRPLPGSGFADPSELFAAAELVGRTVELDLACLATSISAFARLGLSGSLTLNVSPRTLETDDFSVHSLVTLLDRHGVAPTRVVLELTEREAVEDMDRLIRAVESCRAAGMRIAADDVGAGNAGLRLLSQLRFDIVKIDLSLVQGGAVRATSQEVVRTLKDLADRWGALVIAEGVETPEQLAFVRSLGIRAGQGYLLGRPSEAPATTAVDLDALISDGGDWLVKRMRAVPA